MSDEHPEVAGEAQEMIEAAGTLSRVLAAFTASLEQSGYNRAEAMKLTEDYLTCFVAKLSG